MCNCSKEKDSAGRNENSDQLQTEVEKIGRQGYLRKVRAAARKALASTQDEPDKLDEVSKTFSTQVVSLLERGLKATEWNETELIQFAREAAWAGLAASVIETIIIAKDNDDKPGDTAANKCRNQFNRCKENNGCGEGGWCPICCLDCTIEYVGCMGDIVFRRGGLIGILTQDPVVSR